MIQRIQSIWFLLAALTAFCLLFIPIIGVESSSGYHVLYGSGLKTTGGNSPTNIPLLTSTAFAGLISLMNIFNFRNRKLQIRIALLNIILILALSTWFFQIVKGISGVSVLNFEPGIYLPLIAIIFTLLAIRGIKKDEKLIRSADRLR
ncbi:DUF4293 domain-containing protein [Pedobacter sp.]|uniref:DUF4293 domain-containing protein n=1 Tax=Pedobacter sp. TaxID=1411316 RepID=UPI0031E11C50